MQALFKHINQYSRLGEPAIKAVSAVFKKGNLSKGSFLITEGKVCDHLHFIEEGCLRGFYNHDGKEISYWFAFENDFITSFYSFITRRPCIENIQAIENCTIWTLSYQDLQSLYNNHPELERLGRLMNERYYMRLEERFVRNHFKEARERYENLIVHSPHIIQRIPLGYVASYLGITQETLSRIRGKA